MKTRKIIAYILVLVMALGLFAGCKKTTKKNTDNKNVTKATEAKQNSEPSKPSTPSTPATKPSTPSTSNNTSTKPTAPVGESEPTQPTLPTTPPDPECEHIPSVDWDVAVSCTAEGVRKKYCILCGGVVESEVIPIQPHELVWKTEKDPTCTEPGSMYQQCTRCWKTFVYIQTEALGHKENPATGRCDHCQMDMKIGRAHV